MPTINAGRIAPGTGEVTYREEMLDGGTGTGVAPDAAPETLALTVRGRNAGRADDFGLYLKATGTDDVVLHFKSLRAGPGIGMLGDADSILVYNNRVISNAGSGAGLVLGDFGSETRVASLRGDNGVTVALDGSEMVIGIDRELGVVAGRGLEKNGAVLDMTVSGVGPGTYIMPRITVDATGRITSAFSTQAVNLGGGHAVFAGRSMADDLQFRTLVAGPGLELATTENAITIGLAANGVEPGRYEFATLTVDGAGRVTRAESNSLGGENMGAGAGVFHAMAGSVHRFKSLKAGTGVVVTSDDDEITIASTGEGVVRVVAGEGLTGGTITSEGTIALPDTGVAAGSYTAASITVDAKGRITSATTTTNVATLNRPQTYSGQQNSAMVALTGPDASWNLDLSNVYTLRLAAHTTVEITGGMIAGGTYVVIVEQASPGGFTITWDSVVKWPSGVIIDPSPDANTWTIYSFVSDGVRLFATGVGNYV